MTDFNDLDDIFGEDFDDEIDLNQASITVDDFDEEIFIDDDQGGLNRTFLFVGLALLGTFASIMVGIFFVPQGEDADAIATAAAIETLNAQAFTQAASTNEAFETQVAIDNSDTATAIAGVTLEAEQQATATIDQLNTQVAATATQRSVFATQTEFANQTEIAAELTANAPTAVPTVSIRFEIRDANGNPLPEGAIIQIYQDDGDREFNPIATPTLPPTSTPTSTPSATATPEATNTATVDPAVAATNSAQTLEANISEFDRIATARAEQENATSTPTPTDEPTAIAEDNTTTLGSSVVAQSGSFAVQVPEGWQIDDQTAADGSFVFGESAAALASVTDDPDALIQVAGPAGNLTYFSSDTGSASSEDLDALQAILENGVLDRGGTFSEPIENVIFPNTPDSRVGRYTIGEYDGYLVLMLFDEGYIAGLFAAESAVFDQYADLFIEVSQSVETSLGGVGFIPEDVFMKIDQNPAQEGRFQGGSTPTPPPAGGDALGVPIVIEPDGGGTINLPGEPGTYFLVVNFPPGIYIIFIEGQEVEFEVILEQFTETVVILADRTLIIRAFGVPEILPSPTPTIPTATATVPLQDTPISAFLQTATAAARTIVPVITETVVVTRTIQPSTTVGPGTPLPTEIPETGFSIDGSSTPEGLTMLALMGIGLLGVVFVVRRIRANM